MCIYIHKVSVYWKIPHCVVLGGRSASVSEFQDALTGLLYTQCDHSPIQVQGDAIAGVMGNCTQTITNSLCMYAMWVFCSSTLKLGLLLCACIMVAFAF